MQRNGHSQPQYPSALRSVVTSVTGLTCLTTVATMTVALLALCAPVHAEMYKWVDENGKVHFTDKPVNSPNAEEIEVQQQKLLGQDDSVRGINERVQRLRQSEQEAQAIEDNARIKREAQASKISDQCARNKRRLGRLDGSVYRLNKEGERVYLSDTEMLQEREILNKWLKENC